MSTESTDQIEQAAAEWLIRRQSDDWTQSHQAEFDRWLAEATLNRVAYLRLELGWEDAGRLKALATSGAKDCPPLMSELNLTPFLGASPPSRADPAENSSEVARSAVDERMGRSIAPAARLVGHFGKRFLAVAAMLLAAIAAGSYIKVSGILEGDPYTTRVGAVESLAILDGSKIVLNTDSQIRVTLTDTERRIDLKHGEAFFEVAKDSRRPFVVNVGTKRVIALGTKFSVRRNDGSMQVIVTDGKVRVEDTVSPLRVTLKEADTAKEQQLVVSDVLLTVGEIASASDSGILVQRKSLPEAEEKLSWRSGVLMFRNEPLSQAASEFNRYNTKQIVINDAAVASLPIEGNFRATNAVAFAHLLENGYPVIVKEEDDRIILAPR